MQLHLMELLRDAAQIYRNDSNDRDLENSSMRLGNCVLGGPGLLEDFNACHFGLNYASFT